MTVIILQQQACWPGPLQQLSRGIGGHRRGRLGRTAQSRPTESHFDDWLWGFTDHNHHHKVDQNHHNHNHNLRKCRLKEQQKTDPQKVNYCITGSLGARWTQTSCFWSLILLGATPGWARLRQTNYQDTNTYMYPTTWCIWSGTWQSSHLIVLVIDRLSAVHLDGGNTRVGNVLSLLPHKPGHRDVGDCAKMSQKTAPSLFRS